MYTQNERDSRDEERQAGDFATHLNECAGREKELSIMECEPSIMRPSKCPKCDNELIKCNEDELVCTMCYFYWIDGKWFRVCCDDFHNHTKKCLIEIDDLA